MNNGVPVRVAILNTALCCLFVAAPQVASLKDVQKIYIGDMGKSDEAERFRLLLEDSLTKEKFTVVEDEQEADAVLTGILSVRLDNDKSRARATIRLKTASGETLWRGDFQPKHSFSLKRKDDVARRAMEVAQTLAKARKGAR